MNFLYPPFLWALFAISIPIIIHLFNFRRYKKIYFTNVQFLKDIKQESDSKSKLKEWLILVMRILAITCLVFAFAQPFIPVANTTSIGQKAISVFIDNSYSMEQIGAKGSAFENSKLMAIDLANAFGANDKFQILTNDFEAVHQRLLSKEEFITKVNELKISSASKHISDILKRQQDFLKGINAKQKRLFVISDFQQNNTNVKEFKIDSSIIVGLLPMPSNQSNNLFIDSVWLSSPIIQLGSQLKINARIKNSSAKDIENTTLKLYINNNQVALADFKIAANSQAEVSTMFTVKQNGIHQGTLKIDDYPITFDDEFYFSFTTHPAIKVLVINGKETQTASYFKSLFTNDSLFSFSENSENSIDYGLLSKAKVIVMNEVSNFSSGLLSEIQKFCNAGGSLVIFPPSKINISDYNSAFTQLKLPQIIKMDSLNISTQQINFEQGFYEGVFENTSDRMDLPKVFEHAEYTKNTQTNEQQLISLQNGASFLSYYPFNTGKIYTFSTPSSLKATNFLKHALFVPTFIRIGLLSLKPMALYCTTSSNQSITIPNYTNVSNNPLHIINNEKTIDVIPEQRVINNEMVLFTQNQITSPAHYSVFNDEKKLYGLAFNIDRKESDMNFYDNTVLQNQIDETGFKNIKIIEANEKISLTIANELNEGQKLWKLFLILALVFLLSEILIIRLIK